MRSWISIPLDSDFSLQNLPYGVFSISQDSSRRIGVAIGDIVLDLKGLAQDGVFEDIEFDSRTLQQTTLNSYAGLGQGIHGQVRRKLQLLLAENTQLGHVLRDNLDRRQRCLFPRDSVSMHMPLLVGDFTDFFVGLHHANNVGKFQGDPG
jgi:fumarylacetoacetase